VVVNPKPKFVVQRWELALIVIALGIGLYTSWNQRHWLDIQGTIAATQITSSKNATVDGCVISYRYQVHYKDPSGLLQSVQRSYSEESRTCALAQAAAVKDGDTETVSIDPRVPGQAQEPSLGLFGYLFAALNGAALVLRWVASRRRTLA